MEMETNVINNKIFAKNIFKNKSKRKRNFIIYHFLVESKPHERTDLLTTLSVNIYQTKKKKRYSNSKTFIQPPISLPLSKTGEGTIRNINSNIVQAPTPFIKGGLTSSNLAIKMGMKYFFKKGSGWTKAGIV